MTADERREARRDDRDRRRVTEAHTTDWSAKYTTPTTDDAAAARKRLRQSMTIAQWNEYSRTH